MKELHPSELYERLSDLIVAKISVYVLVAGSIGLTGYAIISPQRNRPMLMGSACTIALIAKGAKELERQKGKVISEIQNASFQGFVSWISAQMQPTSKLTLNVALPSDWKPDNLITNITSYILEAQKHVALVAGTGDGKSTLAQYLSLQIGGRVCVYDSDCKPDEWSWIPLEDVVGRKGNFIAINEAMGKDLEELEELVQLRGEGGDNAIAGRERFIVGEEFPILVDECDNHEKWIKRFAKRGRRYKQFIMVVAQNDTNENFGLQGDKNTLYTCFVLIRKGKKAYEHAKKLGINGLEQWLKAGGKKRFMVDDYPCELDLSNWQPGQFNPDTITITAEEIQDKTSADDSSLNEYEQAILDWGISHSGQIIKARDISNNVRLFDKHDPEDIRLNFQTLADKNIGAVVGEGKKMGWAYTISEE